MPEHCPTCGLPTMAVESVAQGVARYEDSPGGHADRHTLVIEAAERAAVPATPEGNKDA